MSSITSIDESDVLVSSLQGTIARGESSWKNAPNLIIRICNEGRWQTRHSEVLDRNVEFRTFEEFVAAPVPEGLEASIDLLKRLCKGNLKAMRAITKAMKVTERRGRPGEEKNVDIINELDPRPTGTSALQAVRRLEKEKREDLLGRVEQGELSLHGAMVEAGLRKRKISIPDDPVAAAERLKVHFQGDRLAALIRALKGD